MAMHKHGRARDWFSLLHGEAISCRGLRRLAPFHLPIEFVASPALHARS
jgi:hypothetical protein